MEARQAYRILTFGLVSCFPSFVVFWILAILPQIVQNNMGVTNKKEISQTLSFFEAAFFFGLIVGALSWPSFLQIINKRNSILISLIFQGIFNFLTGYSKSIPLIIFFRFATAFSANSNTVGKDFIFDFAKPEYRQYAFSIKSAFAVATSFLGPIFGYFIYQASNRQFGQSMLYVSYFYLIGIVLFIIVFYLDFKPGDIINNKNQENQFVLEDDETEKLNMKNNMVIQSVCPSRKQSDYQDQVGIYETLIICLKSFYLRNLVIVYFITNGIYKAQTLVSILFLETQWQDGGLGVSAQAVAFINMMTYLPVTLTILLAPIFVPRKISYRAFIRLEILVLALALLMLPLTRDLIKTNKMNYYLYIIYGLQSLINCGTPKTYNPFLNYLLNDQVGRESRTSINSIALVLSNFSAGAMVLLIVPFFSISMYDKQIVQFQPFNKYICFVGMILILGISVIFTKNLNQNGKLTEREEIDSVE